MAAHRRKQNSDGRLPRRRRRHRPLQRGVVRDVPVFEGRGRRGAAPNSRRRGTAASNAPRKRTGSIRASQVGRTNKELLQGEATDRDAARSMVAELRRASRSRRVLLNYKKDGTAFWNDVVVQHLGDEQSSARGLGIDLAFLREAKHATDVDASHGRADAFRATRKLAPFHGELAEGTLCPAA
mmetsp:Transcript_30852/g.92615  ORF Transcript_30852/g.92615 Transcript_30852/m.92615 type:complete len:183 (+) Transcript_30852:491-1039(+)